MTIPRTSQLMAGLLSVLFVVTAGWTAEVAAQETGEAFPWIVEPERAAELIEGSEVSVLDTRKRSRWKAGHLPGAVTVDWEDFTPSADADRGKLSDDDDSLQTAVRKLGVDSDRPVLVVGNPPDNWGEDGRIVWTLRTLGHDRVALVDGGHGAVVDAGVDSTTESTDPETGDFEIERRSDWAIEREQVRETLGSDAVLLDTRSEREYNGGTPYGEARAGHLPGAKHLHYLALLDDDGRLRPEAAIRQTLADHGIESGTRVIAYCTGGVRSAWLTVVLRHLGYHQTVNYAGSAWDWAAANEATYPLEVE